MSIEFQNDTVQFMIGSDKKKIALIPSTSAENKPSSYSRVFTHYIKQNSSKELLPIDEQEFHRAILGAQQSYQVWKKMKEKILLQVNKN